MKKTVAFLVGVLMAVMMMGTSTAQGDIVVDGQNSDYVEYVGSKDKNPIVPAPIELAPIEAKMLRRSAALPARYDLRDKKFVTSVKDQKSGNGCWTFSSIGALESHLLAAKKGSKDFSELHMEYMLSKYSKGGGAFADGKTNPLGYNRNVDDGGNAYMAVAYSMGDKGVVAESKLPYTDNFRPLSLSSLMGMSTGNVWLKDFEFLPPYSSANKVQLREAMKSRIMQYGGLDAGMYLDSKNVHTSLYQKGSSLSTNHAIVIVGWDDNYAKEKFRPNTPSSNGAWIVKNSHGVNNYEKGYMYISYEELPIYEMIALPRRTGNKSDYNKMYSYDPLGANYVLSSKVNTIYGINKFTGAKAGESLSAVTFFSGSPANYEIYVSPNGQTTSIKQMTKIASGNMDYIGYKTVDIAKPVGVSANFNVAVKLSSSAGAKFGVEGNDYGLWSTATAKTGESLASYDGESWGQISAIGKPANASIKAFTKTTPVTATTPTGLKVTSKANNKIAISWNAVPGINRYAIYRSKSKDTGYVYLGVSSGNSYVNTGLKPGDTYYYKVLSSVAIAGGKYKNSALSAPISATVVKTQSPATWAPPTGVKTSGITEKKVTFKWNEVAGAQRYAIYWSYRREGPYRYGTWKGNVNTATFYGMVPNRNYYFKILAGKYINGKWVYNSIDDCNAVYVRSKSL